jgi:23S rRNA pseudouridine1911/1915/1917 synthase
MFSNPDTTIYRFLVSDETAEDAAEALSPQDGVISYRLDRFLADAMADLLSREQLKRLIRQGCIAVNEATQLKASYRVSEGDTVTVNLPEARPISLEPEAIPLEIVYEDTDLVVVNKPSGMLTHPTGREATGTLVNALLAHCEGRLSGINGMIRPGIVHRLDRETSGLLMVAKTDRAHRSLSEQLKAKTARREYRAIVQGVMPSEVGTVEAPIGRNPKQRDKMGVIEGGRPAVTHWRVVEVLANEKFSWLELKLETGRTHQIRVHMAHIGHPLLGDPLYGSGVEKIMRIRTQGQVLQAFRLAFEHPEDGRLMVFELEAEAEMARVLAELRQ